MTFYKSLLPILLIISFVTKGQTPIDKAKAEKLYKETKPLYISFFSLQVYKHDSAKIVCKLLINKFTNIYMADTTDKKIGNYLAECYLYDKDYEKAIYWNKHQIRCHARDRDNIFSFQDLAQAYLFIGKIDSGKKYITKAITIREKKPGLNNVTPVFLLNLISIVDKTINMSDSGEIEILKSKSIEPCKYAIAILNFIRPYAKKSTEDVRMQFEQEAILLKKRKCQ